MWKKLFILFFIISVIVLCYFWYNVNAPKGNTISTYPTQTRELPRPKDPQPQANVPEYVIRTLQYVRDHQRPPRGYVGGRAFENRERLLPAKTPLGEKITYQEWDVHPRKPKRNRGSERLVTGSDASAWFSKDHYDSFIRIE